MKRYYRVLFLFSIVGVALGIVGALLEQSTVALLGCLFIPAASYLLAIGIDLFRRWR